VLLSSSEQMSCSAGTNGCFDLRCHAFPLDGQVSAEWSRCTGSVGRCGSFATKLNRLDVCEDKKIVCWYRVQGSSHSSQSIVDGRVNEAVVKAAAPVRNVVAPAAQPAISRVQHVMLTFCN